MGNHYVPQLYLRGFTEAKTIWVHDRLESRSFPSQPKTIANENALYTGELENHLANTIEDPAKPAIERIRSKAVLRESDRIALARYIINLWKRVPEGRERVAARIPEVAASVREELHQQIAAASEINPKVAHLEDARKAEVDAVLERFERERPPELWQQSLTKNSSDEVVESLLSMQWRFLYSGRHQFLTCDNPVFFFEHEGIGGPTSELTIPFSSSVALWANRRNHRSQSHLVALPAAVREINRRVASSATRFIFSKHQESWILPFVCKSHYSLNRLL